MPLLGLEADLEMVLWASNISTKGSIRLMGVGSYTMDAAQYHMTILGLEAGLEMALLASNISKKVHQTVGRGCTNRGCSSAPYA
jgi:hypothetical protein